MTTDSEQWMPPAAVQRLSAMRGSGPKPALFTSDLSVNEFILAKEAGFSPLGFVVGSSVYHVGLQVGRWSQSQELTVLTQAMYQARELAMSRMEAEADALGADGVIGVRLEIQFFGAEAGDMAEFLALGTAVRADPGGDPSLRTRTGKPFTSDLSGQDFWALYQAGWRPLSLVLGTCVYHVAHQSLRQTMKNLGQNTEMPQYTAAVYDARELALSRMQAEAAHVGAEGIVGVRVDRASHVWGMHAIEFLAVGTAVGAVAGAEPMAKPALVLPLQG